MLTPYRLGIMAVALTASLTLGTANRVTGQGINISMSLFDSCGVPVGVGVPVGMGPVARFDPFWNPYVAFGSGGRAFTPFATPLGCGYPNIVTGYGYGNLWWGYPGSWGYHRLWVAPPLAMPAETLYGPQAVQRFMGIGANNAAWQDNLVAPASFEQPGAVGLVNPAAPRAQVIEVRASNARSRRLAAEQRHIGDNYFRTQRYDLAVNSYRTGTSHAPDMADLYLRMAMAHAALGRYEYAATSLQRAIVAEPTLSHALVALDELYQQDSDAKAAHIEALAEAALAQSERAELLLVLGVQLLLDGQGERSLLMLQRALELAPHNPTALAFWNVANERTTGMGAAAGGMAAGAGLAGEVVPPVPVPLPMLPRPEVPRPAAAEPMPREI